MSNAKKQALEMAISQIEKQFGKGSIMKLGDNSSLEVECISTGILGLDKIIGKNGVPRGRIIEIFGPESSGKTTLALQIIKQAQLNDGLCAFIDAEHSLDPSYAQKIGIDINNLYISQPDNGEQALEICENLIRSGALDVIVVDSVAALVPKAEIDGEMGDSFIGLQARLMSQAMRKLAGAASKSKTVVIFINQIREKVGVMFGSPETTTGGRALKFYASVRIDVRKVDSIKQGENIVGNKVRIKIVKNKIAPPFKQIDLDLFFEEGFSRESNLIDLAVEKNIINKSGSWFSYKNEKIGQGKENVKKFLKENPMILTEIENEIKSLF